jgi:hypothetical protein
MLCDSEAKASAATVAGPRAVNFIEPLKHAIYLMRWNADAGIADNDQQRMIQARVLPLLREPTMGRCISCVCRAHRNADAATCGRELERIIEQIQQHLSDTVGVQQGQRQVSVDLCDQLQLAALGLRV